MIRRNTRQVISGVVSLKEFIRQTKNKTIQELTFLLPIKNYHSSFYSEIPASYYVFKSFSSHCHHPTGHFSN